MQRIIFYVIALVLFGAAACNPTGSLGRPENQPPNNSQASEQTVKSIRRVGDSPPFDSPSLAIQCIDERTCWVSSPGILWQSLDGGGSWKEIYSVPKDQDIASYDFVDDRRGWLILSNKLYTSEDGGQTWTYRASPIEYPNGEMRSLWFLRNGKTGWIAGGVYRPQTAEELKSGVPNDAKDVTGKRVLEEAIFRTSDSGHTWQRQFSSKLWGRILRIQTLDESQGIALGEVNAYYTANGGANWERIGLKKNCVRKEYFNDYYDASPDNAVLIDSRLWLISYNDGRIIKSIDGGRSWCDLAQPGQIKFEDNGSQPRYMVKMHFESREHGLGLGRDRFLYETRDGGSSWVRASSDIGFVDMAFPANDRAVLISEKGIYEFRF